MLLGITARRAGLRVDELDGDRDVVLHEEQEARQQLVVSVYSYQDPAKVKGGSTRVAPRVWASSTMREGEVVETDVVGLIETRRYEPAMRCPDRQLAR